MTYTIRPVRPTDLAAVTEVEAICFPAAEAAAGQDGLAHLFVLPPQSTLTIHVGKRKIKLRPEELQKVTGERGRRGSLMRGLQKIDRVEIDSPRRAAAGDSEE